MQSMVWKRSQFWHHKQLSQIPALSVSALLACSFLFPRPAVGKVHTNTEVNTRTNAETYDVGAGTGGSMPITTPVKVDSPSDSGVTLSTYLPISEMDQITLDSLDLQNGEDSLHPEGECGACDELRKMYRDGKVDELHRVIATPTIEGDEELFLSVPTESDAESCTCYCCDNGSLKEGEAEVSAARDQDERAHIEVSGSARMVQSPFGIAYGKSSAEESENPEVDISAKSSNGHKPNVVAGNSKKTVNVHAYTPGDDDDETAEKQEELDNSRTLIAIVVLAAVIVFARFAVIGRSIWRS